MEEAGSAPRVILTRDDHGAIHCKDYEFLDEPDFVGTSALCDDGSRTDYKVPTKPPRHEFLGIDIADCMSYNALKIKYLEVCDWPDNDKREVMNMTDWSHYPYDFDEELGWLQLDDDGRVLPESDTFESMRSWLNEPISYDHEVERWLERMDPECSQYAPGFLLRASLPEPDVERLQLSDADRGGPASSVPCVSCDASTEDLNAAIEANNLPYVFVDER